jgi:hypothetical protein
MNDNKVEVIGIKEASEIVGVHPKYFKKKFLLTGLLPTLSYSNPTKPKMLKSDVEKFVINSRMFYKPVGKINNSHIKGFNKTLNT